MTILIILATKPETALEKDIKGHFDPISLKFRGLPKALLPISGDSTLTRLYKTLGAYFKKVYLITNAHKYKTYERWAHDLQLSSDAVLNNGNGPLETVNYRADIEHVIRARKIQEPVFIVEENQMAVPADLESMVQIIKNRDQNVLFCETVTDDDSYKVLNVRNFCLDTETNQLVDIQPPESCHKDSSLSQVNGCASGYFFTEEGIRTLIQQSSGSKDGASSMEEILGDFRKLHRHLKVTVQTVYNPLVGWRCEGLGFNEYFNLWYNAPIDKPKEYLDLFDPISVRTNARVGLMGNPSDGYFGKTLSLSIENFWATVHLLPKSSYEPFAHGIEICFNPLCDPVAFESLQSLTRICDTNGYQGVYQLLLATCKVFWTYCKRNRISLPTKAGFRIIYETNIPRQVGLSGSSAIITSLFKALMKYYNVEGIIPRAVQPSLILSVERDELGLMAGLQDRVVQIYGGLVNMDFNQEYMTLNGHGIYESLPISLLPPNLYLAYVNKPKSSGTTHNLVKARWDSGDVEVIEAMRTFASYVEQAKKALEEGKLTKLPALMTSNFQLRRKIFGDAALGAENLRMVEIAERHGFAAKFAGSGGAIVMLYKKCTKDPGGELAAVAKLREALQAEDFVFCKVIPSEGQVV
ncbi:ribosomal protein S5 domain 2-like protein [Basidiobolus meristosporus CBS 931.73]|uniref:Ribosomal protein S5 domain 2-like protein n=1 Tax=Basidiobolus meristosporus CBS 931.73 TaxID=1314790 RepID=A0A1Y1Y2H8_9FUNG|nr:ribosomal protein S5 domain 2-like protein [Basidiobolus meristosporus CBS 931.73]|eukprot:ORX92203.1 ribosomal protein S5 domain 2-like protein [Basidiobolus meristosporus CBS 931.73]